MSKVSQLAIKSLVVLSLLACGMTSVAQDIQTRAPKASDGPLKWKFTAGQKLSMKMDQDVTMNIDAGFQQMEMSNGGVNEMTIIVESVDADGVATAQNIIDRMVVESETPMGNFKFDSASEEEPDGQAAMIADALSPMIGAAITQRMHPSGKISDIKIPEVMLDGLTAGAGPAGAMFNEDTLKELTSKASMVFPEDMPSQGSSWENSAEVAMGPATVRTDTTYTYLGVADVDGKPLHVIKAQISMEFPDGIQGMDVDITNEDSTGMFFFDGNLGRMAKSTLDQNVTMEIAGPGGQAIKQVLNQKMEMVVSDKE